mmetsp:Transcript_31442/g.47743  ORF Transcript_31442/g.47743 Transcript_31442/m.47743 type:complete len:1275 (+) Transcript_31442:33-3857(+)
MERMININDTNFQRNELIEGTVLPMKLGDWLRIIGDGASMHGDNGPASITKSWVCGESASIGRRAQLTRAVHLALALSKATLHISSACVRTFGFDSVSVYEEEGILNDIGNVNGTIGPKFTIEIDTEEPATSSREGGCVSVSEDEGEDAKLSAIIRLGAILHELFSGLALFPVEQEATKELAHLLSDKDTCYHHRTRRKRRLLSQEGQTPLRELGLPTSLCELVSNMLYAAENGEESPPDRYTSLAEVVTDLGLMSSQPRRYLFDNYSNENEIGNAIERLSFQDGKLYGHEAHLSELGSVFGRTVKQPGCGGKRREVVLVSGYSGSGKSSVVQQSIKTCLNENGSYLIHGKFDERMQQAQPLSAVVSAFDSYCAALLEGKRSGLEEVRSSIRDAIGGDSEVLTGLIPKLSQVIGESPAAKNVDVRGQEAQNRLNFIFCKFVRAISSRSCPVVLFLDDLHWADDDSLELIYMLTEDEHSNFLLVGCFRDNEVGEGHPLKSQIQRMEETGVIVTSIKIGNMRKDNVNEMICDSLGLLPRQTKPLSEIVHSKTHGNALFVKQFLTSLFEAGFLRYSPSVRRWTWDIDNIRSKRVTDGVAELMMDKMLRLKSNVQYALMVAACLGSQSEQSILKLLSKDTDPSNDDFIASLDEVVSEGFMFKVGSSTYSFSHDSIQLAAYSLIPDKEAMHLKIGRQLLDCSSQGELESIIFVVAAQLDRGSMLITDPDEKIKLAKLNLKAGEKAIEQSVFSSASLYLREGVKMLSIEDWHGEHYELCLQIHSACVESLGVNGNWDEMRIYLSKIFTYAKCFEDKISGYYSLVKSLGAQNKRADVIDLTVEILSQLGESFPEDPSTSEVLGLDFSLTNEWLEGTTMEGILIADEMENQKTILSMKFLNLLSLYLYIGRHPLLPFTIFRMVRLSLTHGNCKESSLAFASFALMILYMSNDVERAYRFGNLAIDLVGRSNAKDCVARVHLTVFGLISPWKDYAPVCVEGLNIGYEEGMEAGDVIFAMMNAHVYCSLSLTYGQQLDEFIEKALFYAQQMKRYKQTTVLPSTLVYLQFALNLVSYSEDPTVLTGELMDQEVVLKDALENDYHNTVHLIYCLRLWMAYLFGKDELAATMIDQCKSTNSAFSGARTTITVNETFYCGLASTTLFMKTRKKKFESLAYSSIKKMKKFAEDNSWNFSHKVKLLDAEIFVLKQDIDMAKKTYNEAIELAGKHRFIHEQALACERAGTFHSMLGNHITADEYFRRSHELYLKWGAKCKADDVRKKFLTE